jgi:hypothetical protein
MRQKKNPFKVLSFVCHAQLYFTVEVQIIDISKGWRHIHVQGIYTSKYTRQIDKDIFNNYK